jgi:hypothetical protein
MAGDEEERLRAFEVAARTPVAWRDWAGAHMRVMARLWPAVFGASPYVGELVIAMTHAGLAVENLIKGIWIAKDPTLVEGGKLANRLLDHDLPRLAAKAGVEVNSEERTLLARLTPFVRWIGRYLTPAAEDSFASSAIGSDDKDRIAQLVERLIAELNTTVSKPR